jgi:serine/threonine protein kinase
MDAILRVMGNEMPTPKHILPSISPVLDTVIRKAMSLKQEDRYQTVEEMRNAIFADPYIMSTTNRYGKGQLVPDTIKSNKINDVVASDTHNRATLEIINRSNASGKFVFKINEPVSRIGRAAGAPEAIHLDLTNLDTSRIVSRVHATIECRNGRYLLKDNNSHNGTWVNGQKVNANQDYLLKDGDDIRFGSQQPHGIQAIFRQTPLP